MNEVIIAGGFGILGGLGRVLVVSLKSLQLGRFFWKGFWIYLIVVIIVGAFSGVVLGFGRVLSFLAGYAGLDLVDGYYKTFKKKKIKFN